MRLASLVVVGLASVAGAPARATPTGKIVRVERPVYSTGLRFCSVKMTGDRHPPSCVGTLPPRVSDKIAVMDETRMVAELRVSEVRSRSVDCGLWEIAFVPISGSVPDGDDVYGIIGGDIKPKGHVVLARTPTKLPGIGEQDRVGLLFDREGDGVFDIAVSYRECANSEFCIAIWQRVNEAFVEVSLLQNLQHCEK